ncbi:MAG: hydrolase 1, exosortase A system-associated [Halioglobus sp.]|nr:hydrolase 1, exosortase A system-associated [Halioglobus sp.]|tara:strand:- start:2915 stop:3811 length:897 start_codon:yes stop_codon:yes gene_type:complete
MRVEERPLVFDCEGCELIGIVHIPETPRPVGLLAVAAGGIQYRGGCGRQLVSMARQLAAQGFPVLRFDHRGHGDSDGALLGFRHMDEDLARAVQVFRDNVPSLTHVSMFGGCEAASAIMMSGLGLPAVQSAILANPWVELEHLAAMASRAHYRRRLLDPLFWKKLFSGQYNLFAYARDFLGYLARKLGGAGTARQNPGEAQVETPFEERMLAGMQAFDGQVLLLKSGQSFLSEEFDQLVASSAAWRAVCERDTVQRQLMPEADQTFATAASREQLCRSVGDWLARMDQDAARQPAAGE